MMAETKVGDHATAKRVEDDKKYISLEEISVKSVSPEMMLKGPFT